MLLFVWTLTTLAAFYWFREPLLKQLGAWLVVESPLRPADLVVALGGSRERQDRAIELLRQGYAQMVLFTGPDFRSHDYNCIGVAHSGIHPPFVAYTTYEEAMLVKTVLQERGLRSAIVVTSPYHLRRTRMTFERLVGETKAELAFHSSSNGTFSTSRWWKSHYGRKLVLMEYLGLVYYWLQLNLC